MTAKVVYEKIKDFRDSAEKIEQCDEKANELDYNQAVKYLEKATDRVACMAVKSDFEKIRFYKDSAEKMKECDEKANEIDYTDALKEMQNAKNQYGYERAAIQFSKIGDYKDSQKKKNECKRMQTEIINAAIYDKAINLYNSKLNTLSISDELDTVSRAKKAFESIHDYRDSEEMVIKCAQRIKELNKKIDATNKAEEKRKMLFKIISIIIVLSIIILIVIGIF